ncbi:hypothetical protein BSU04_08530 [Caballeronia sordidicola]|uniref:Uncharacterized protein n=1 Tax=Caballeronia sordidicola TaxID=196367 RepID=A0A226X6X1_CABSO|nr:hypothetical protein BSU04_08530 [Caballeronia sordidicola]
MEDGETFQMVVLTDCKDMDRHSIPTPAPPKARGAASGSGINAG